jgi:hypothetical protein
VDNKKWRKWCKFVSPILFNNIYGIHVLTKDTKCPKQVFNVYCSIYRLFVIYTAWKPDSFQMMIYVNDCCTLRKVELKTRFETWITRNDVNGISFSPLLFNNTYVLPVLTKDTKCPNLVLYVRLVGPDYLCK